MAGNDLLKSRADAAVLSRDFALAARLYNTLLQQSPDDVELLEKLGSIYVKSGDDKKALPYYIKINQKKPKDFNTLNSLGGIYRRLKQYENSISVLKEALELNTKIDQVNYNLGFTYKFMGEYDEAVDCFESVIQANPTDVLAYNHLGTIYQKRNENQKAIQTFLKALKVDRNHPILHLNLAKSYEQEGQNKNAIAEYEAALRSKPGWNDAINDYSKLLLSLNKTKEAKEIVSQALAVDPQNSKMHSTMGKIYAFQSDYESSAAEYKKALAVNPESNRALIGMAEALEESGNALQAVDYIEKAERKNPDDLEILKKSASVNLSANKVASAGEKIKTLLKVDKEDVEALDLAGQFFIVKNEDAKAANFYNRIQQLDPRYIQHWLKAAKRYRQVGKLEKAEGSIKRYIQKKPDDSKALTNLALICESLGKTNDALANFKKALQLDANNVCAKRSLLRISDHITDVDTSIEEEIPDPFTMPDPQIEETPQGEEKDESLIIQKIADDTALVDDEASSTDSDLWKSESWDADTLVEENDDPFSILDGNDESILTGPGGTPIEEDTSLPEDIPEEELKDTSLDSLADANNQGGAISADGMESDDLFSGIDGDMAPESDTSDSVSGDGNGFDADAVNEEDFGDTGLGEEDLTPSNIEKSFDDEDDVFDQIPESISDEENISDSEPVKETESKFEPEPASDSSFNSPSDDIYDDGISDIDALDTSAPIPGYEMPDSLDFEEFPEEKQVPPKEEYREPPRYIIQKPAPNSIDKDEAKALMESMKKTQAEAEKAMAAAEKAWMAANQAADAAQAASDSENSLTELATDAVMQAAEQVRMQAEEIAKEATDKALADRMDKIDSILPQFEKMLEDKDTVPDQDDEQVQKALMLFKSLRALGESLPGDSRTSFMQSSNRMRMDYIISRLSGNEGLLKTSQKLRDSGAVENCVREEEVPLNYKGKRLAIDVLRNMTDMSRNLEDKDLSIGLEKIVNNILIRLN